MRKCDKNIILLLSEYHIFPIRNNAHAVFQAPAAFTSWQRSDWNTETQISRGVSGGNSLFIALSIIITHACLQTWICGDTARLFLSFLFFSYFPPSFVHLYLCVFRHVHCRYVFLCLFALNNQRERTQRHCNYNHYYHKNNLSLYSCTRRTHLIESISFADDGFTFCHGRCCLISMPWKYAFFFFFSFQAYLSCLYLICCRFPQCYSLFLSLPPSLSVSLWLSH